MQRFLCVLSFAICAGCHSFTGPTVALNQQFTLAPGDSAHVEGSRTFVTFTGVNGDSRCPADAFCIQGGDARVGIDVADGTSNGRYELHTGDMRPVQHGDLTIALVKLSPYPFGVAGIQPNDYRATLTVSR